MVTSVRSGAHVAMVGGVRLRTAVTLMGAVSQLR